MVQARDLSHPSHRKRDSILVNQNSYETMLWTDKPPDRQTDRQTARQTDRQIDKQIDSQTVRQSDRQTDRQTDGQTDGRTYGRADRRSDGQRIPKQTRRSKQNLGWGKLRQASKRQAS